MNYSFVIEMALPITKKAQYAVELFVCDWNGTVLN